jgi:hypothetical protein
MSHPIETGHEIGRQLESRDLKFIQASNLPVEKATNGNDPRIERFFRLFYGVVERSDR